MRLSKWLGKQLRAIKIYLINMAQKIEQFSRLLMHRLTSQGGQFTVPTSNDHTDETWSETDLYIGEIGINVTDDTAYFRTNNGIVQIATGTSSGATGSSDIWTFNSGDVALSPTYSVGAVIGNSTAYTDMGSSATRWKDLYLGGSVNGFSQINVNNGLTILDSSDYILTSVSGGSNAAQINIGVTASNGTKERPLHLNSNNTSINGFGGERVIMASQNSAIGSSSFRSAIVSGFGVTISNSTNNCLYVGVGRGREYVYSDSLGIGGKLVLSDVDDDGSGTYMSSELIKGQFRLTTSNALTTPIFTKMWDGPFESWGEVIQIKAMVLGVDVTDPGLVYSTEILFTAQYNDATSLGSLIGDPIINEVSTFPDSVEVTGYADNVNVEINVKGTGANTIQWLCSYEYHRIINIV